MKLSSVYSRLLEGKGLNQKEAFAIFTALFKERLTEPQAKSLLLLLAKKGEGVEEVLGCLKALRRLEPFLKFRAKGLLDTCGTGGDHSGSLNISTLAAIVIAGAGGKVAKHGNRGISSRCGSSDLMEALGVALDAPQSKMFASIKQSGIGYFHAPFYHPVFSRVQALRRKLKTKTVFNLLGPLTNPLKLSAQLVGVSSPQNFDLYAEIFRRLRYPKRVLLCRSLDRMDELSTSADTEIAWIQKGKIKRMRLKTKTKASKKDFQGGDAAQNKKIALRLLSGNLRGPIREIVILNAGAGLWTAGKAPNLKEGIRLAENSLNQGKALQALTRLKKIS